mmetsp:Transcript_2437/g.5560  ORF Transcript_2437/g.5560 Transcript_2437/m.5560 type:complete len:264 (-) Transcript_2437:140-931(-)
MILGKVANDPDAGKFILKLKDEFQAASLQYLRSTGNFPEAGADDSDDEMVFGDDFDCDALEDQAAEPAEPEVIPSKEFDAKQEKALKKVTKAGGKRGVEIEGAADMGGLHCFSTYIEEPNGDEWLLLEALKAMNIVCAPDEEERKGCSGHICKSVYSTHVENKHMSYIVYVPKDQQEKVDLKGWFEAVNKAVMGDKVAEASTMILGKVANDPDAGKFILKLKDEFQAASLQYLRSTGNFPEAGADDSDDEMVFGDDFDCDALE